LNDKKHMIDKTRLPRHVAVIMDGNGRWARKRHLPNAFGHKEGAKSVDNIVECCRGLGIEALTLYAFSSENWKRPAEEINALMGILKTYLEKRLKKLQENNIRLNAIGRLAVLPQDAMSRLSGVMEKTAANTGMVLTLALNYGSRQEITDAVLAILNDLEKGIISKDDINEKKFSEYLYTKDLPDVDLVIRTSGESRISNFLLWQISYAEIVIVDALWPDFRDKGFYSALEEYQRRDRRFGGR
jgi:undecaprenyl diphosphate synthase